MTSSETKISFYEVTFHYQFDVKYLERFFQFCGRNRFWLAQTQNMAEELDVEAVAALRKKRQFKKFNN